MTTILRAALVSLLGCAAVRGQCATAWNGGNAIHGTDQEVVASTLWDADGPGPLPAKLVVAGTFTSVADVAAARVAAWDPASGTWSALGTPPSGILAVAALPNGDLVIGGNFQFGVPVMRWNGQSWSPMGTGPGFAGSTFGAMTVLANGDLVVAGSFGFERWNGTSWSPGPPAANGPVFAMAPTSTGGFVAGGLFTTIGSANAVNVAYWTGSAWFPLGAGLGSSANHVRGLLVLPNQQVVATGTFPGFVARWSGTSWLPFGSGPGAGCLRAGALARTPSGDLVVHAVFAGGSVDESRVVRWNGSAWSTLGSGAGHDPQQGLPPQPAWLSALAVLPGGDLVAGGYFTLLGGVPASNLARWNGSAWSPMALGTNRAVRAVAELPNGDLIAGGTFTVAGGVAANRIARWNGTTWSALATGVDGMPALSAGYPTVAAVAVLPGGDLVATGVFTSAGGQPANGIARWNGASWSPLGSGLDGHGSALLVLPTGDLVVGGLFSSAGGVPAANVARWNGSSWSPLGSGLPGEVRALARMANGDVAAGGSFFSGGVGNGVSRWNGSSWVAVGTGTSSSVFALATMPNGDLIAGGTFTTAGGSFANNVARWNGVAWASLGNGVNAAVRALAVTPGGELVVGGDFSLAGAIFSPRLARWNGSTWLGYGSGANASVAALGRTANGEIVAGGSFSLVDGAAAAYLAKLTTTCPALVQPLGAGCPGSSGAHLLTATLPWTGSVWRADASNLPPAAAVLRVIGWSATSLPLAAVFPTALPGCTLHVAPDLLDGIVVANGAASIEFAIPNAMALAGVVFHHQMVPIALDATLAMTATDALQMTVGSF